MISSAIVVDDQASRTALCHILTKHDDFQISLVCGSKNAVERIAWARPAVLFLDTEFHAKSGFDILGELRSEPVPLLIFVTTTRKHATRAFDVQAVDYLLKPLNEERVVVALQRLRARRSGTQNGRYARWPQSRAVEDESQCANAERIAIRDGTTTKFLLVRDIDWIRSAGSHVELYVGKRVYQHRDTLSSMESRLDRNEFTRIHRYVIVNDRKVESIRRGPNTCWEATLKGGTELSVGNAYRWELANKLGISVVNYAVQRRRGPSAPDI